MSEVMKYRGRLDMGNSSIHNNDKNTFIEEYYSGVDTSITIDGEEFKEAQSINFNVQEQIKPLYGYASSTFDDVAIGNRIVVGSIVVPLKNEAPDGFATRAYVQGEGRSLPYDAEDKIPGWARNNDKDISMINGINGNLRGVIENDDLGENNTKLVQRLLVSLGYNDIELEKGLNDAVSNIISMLELNIPVESFNLFLREMKKYKYYHAISHMEAYILPVPTVENIIGVLKEGGTVIALYETGSMLKVMRGGITFYISKEKVKRCSYEH